MGKIYPTRGLIEFNSNRRGGKSSELFYDTFPDVDNEAKLFATNERQEKYLIVKQLVST